VDLCNLSLPAGAGEIDKTDVKPMTEPSESSLLILREPPLAYLIINRPASRNAVNAEVWRSLAAEASALAQDKEVRVLIICGTGDKAFISGADVAEFPALRANAALTAEYDRLANSALQALLDAPQPVIAMIRGVCFGGGVLLALTCDLRFAGEDAKFAIPAGKLGLAYPFEMGVQRLVRIAGPAHAADILFSGRAFDAKEALAIGLVNRLLPGAELESFTREYALKMAQIAPLSLAAHKIEIQQALSRDSEKDLARAEEAVRRCLNSADYQEGIAAFLEKREPRFTGE
jgi:enoyl-CoA hydratase/carnithine racemase